MTRRVQKQGRSSVHTDAAIDAVWAVVRDVTRTGEWSHECLSVTWLGDATEARPGARFRGRNRGACSGGDACEIVRAEPYALVWRTVSSALYPDSTQWAITLRPQDHGTVIEQTFEVVKAPKVLDVVYALLIPAHRDRTTALTEDLRRLGEVAADSVATPS